MNVGLVAYFTDRLEAAKAALAPAAELRVLIERDRESIERLRAERMSEADFQKQAESKGLAVASLTARINDLNRQIDAHEQRIADHLRNLENVMASSGEGCALDAKLAANDLALAEMLAKAGWREAVIAKRGDRLPGIDVSLSEREATSKDAVLGEVRKLNVSIAGVHLATLAIKQGSRRFTPFVPDSLRWAVAVPAREPWGNARAERRAQPKTVYLIEDTQQAILTGDWRSDPHKDGDDHPYDQPEQWGSRKQLSERERLKSMPMGAWRVDDAGSAIVSEIQAAGGALDIASPENGPLLLHVADAVKELTSDKPTFGSPTGPLTSGDIETQIKPHWQALADAPWSGDIRCELASLKFNVELGERARFWVGKYSGHFGFRLRTRDHSWLIGELYISPSTQGDGSIEPGVIRVLPVRGESDIQGSLETSVAAIGRMTLRVREHHDGKAPQPRFDPHRNT